ncbi:MAG: glutaredoxin domain-containing protein [Pseudomonadota bacterium]
MTKVDVYTKPWCHYSGRAINLLKRRGIAFNEINISTNPDREVEMKTRSARTTVPQVFVGHVHIGGSDELFIADKTGLLQKILDSDKQAQTA